MRYALLFVFAFAACGLAHGEDVSGLKLTIESGNQKDVREARLVALYVANGTAPSPFLPPGKFKATWDGFITQRIKGTYTFSSQGTGVLTLTINDQPVDLKSNTVQLKKGKNTLHAEYQSPDSGHAIVRLIWSAKEFIAESVPPTVFAHDASDELLQSQAKIRRGRELFATLRCIKCHAPDQPVPTSSMPELQQDAPSLANLGERVKYGWLARWITDPKSIRPQAHMPRVFANLPKEEAEQNGRDIATFLAPPRPPPGDAKNIPCDDGEKGARLFVNLGCIACHTAPNSKTRDPTRLPLDHVFDKMYYSQLKQYLLKPQAHYAWTRMPDFHLTDREAHLLAVYLIVNSPVPPADPPEGDPARGQRLVATAGCLSCHPPLAGVANQSAPPALSKVKNALCRAVDYTLDENDRAALESFANAGFNSLNQDTPAEFAERQIAQLNCIACHARDKQDDRWSALSDEISHFPQIADKEFPEPEGDQSRPPLTWAGEKLRPQWMIEFISGHLNYKPRPWLVARMPSFESRAKLISEGLAAAHGCLPSAAPNPPPDSELAPIGKKLSGRDGGFACIQCHAVASAKALSPFEAPAINFAHVSDRLTKEFYDRWVYNPQRVLPGTRMPSFADLNGKTALKETFDGDARKQFDAIWNYLLAGETIQPPQ